MGHQIPERLDERNGKGRFTGRSAERAGAAKVMGRTLTATDHKALQRIQEYVRGKWSILTEEVNDDDWRKIIRARVEVAQEKTPQGLKNAELLFRYLLGDKAPSGEGQRTRLEVLVAAILRSPLVARPEEIEAIKIVAERTWIPADSSTVPNSPAPVENEVGGGRGEGGEVAA